MTWAQPIATANDCECNQGQFALADEITKEFLGHTPGVFGKLVLLSSLFDHETGEYRHPALEGAVVARVASHVLRCNYERVFAQWLDLVLEDQWKELVQYLAAPSVAEPWRELSQDFAAALVPTTACRPERELFLSDLKLVLSLVETESSYSG